MDIKVRPVSAIKEESYQQTVEQSAVRQEIIKSIIDEVSQDVDYDHPTPFLHMAS